MFCFPVVGSLQLLPSEFSCRPNDQEFFGPTRELMLRVNRRKIVPGFLQSIVVTKRGIINTYPPYSQLAQGKRDVRVWHWPFPRGQILVRASQPSSLWPLGSHYGVSREACVVWRKYAVMYVEKHHSGNHRSWHDWSQSTEASSDWCLVFRCFLPCI